MTLEPWNKLIHINNNNNTILLKNNTITASLNTANKKGHCTKQLMKVRVFDADYPILHNLSTAKTDMSFSVYLHSNQQICQNILAHHCLVHWRQETIIHTAVTHCFSIIGCSYILKWSIKINVVFQNKDWTSLKMIMMLRACILSDTSIFFNDMPHKSSFKKLSHKIQGPTFSYRL